MLRRRTGRAGLALAASLLVGVGGMALAAPAGAIGGDTLAGTVAAPTPAVGGRVVYTYVLTLATAATAPVLDTQQDADLVASTVGGATVDGAALPASQITRVGQNDLHLQLAASSLAAGAHTITFTATVGSSLAVTTSSSATFTATGGRTATAAPIVLPINVPNLAIAFADHESQVESAPLGDGRVDTVDAEVTNLGYGSPSSAVLISVPVGLAVPDPQLELSTGATAPCTPSTTVARALVCNLGPVARGAVIQFEFDFTTASAAAASAGSVAVSTFAVAPLTGQGTDSDTSDNAIQAQLVRTGTAHLSFSIKPAAKIVHVGTTTTVQLAVHNAGPQPAGETIAISATDAKYFTITGFSGKTVSLASLGANAPAASSAAATGLLWDIGTLAPGATIRATLHLKAIRIGSAKLALVAVSDAGDPTCDATADEVCTPAEATIAIHAVPAVVTKAASTTSTPELAATGAAPLGGVGAGAALVLLGAGLLRFGRRRAL